VDERTVDQIWGFARDFGLDDAELDADIDKAIDHTFAEDMAFLAGQQRNMEKDPGRLMLNNSPDAGVVLARRVIDEMLVAETRISAPAK